MLVDYASSSEDEDEKRSANSPPPPPAKRQKKLPSLPSSFNTAPKDDPSLHQGRSRSRPFVEGEYNTHLYLSLTIPSSLLTILNDIISSPLPSPSPIHPLLPRLHISLTRPLPLRRDQIQFLKDELHQRFCQVQPFRLSLAGRVKAYFNEVHDDVAEQGRRRGFLALRVGAGSVELKTILDKTIHPILDVFHLPSYHDKPEFHTSFAWALLDNPGSARKTHREGDPGRIDVPEPPGQSQKGQQDSLFSERVLEDINLKFERSLLSAQPRGGWTIDSVDLKISKEVTTIPLGLLH